MKFNVFLVLSALAYCSSLVLAVPIDGYLTTREISGEPFGDIEAREVSNTSTSNISARSFDSDDLERRDSDETLVAREPQRRYGGRGGRRPRPLRRCRRRSCGRRVGGRPRRW